MASFENYLNSFRADLPEKKEFKGKKQDALNTEIKLIDLNNDGKTNLADALSDGILTTKEYKGLSRYYQVDKNDKAEFDNALNKFFQGQVPASGIDFSEQINELSNSNGIDKELVFSEVNKTQGYNKAELVTGNIGIKITDKDGINLDSKADIDISLTGETTINTVVPDGFELPGGINVSVNNGSISLNLFILELLNIKIEKAGIDSQIVIKPPSSQLMELSQVLGIKVPEINEKMVGQLFGLKEEMIKKDGDNFRVSLLEYLKNKFPEGIPAGSKKLNLNTLDLSAIIIKEAELVNNKLKIRLDFNNAKINAGTGKEQTEAKLNETLELNVAVGDLTLGDEVSPLSALSYGNIKLVNFSEEIRKAIVDLGDNHLKDVKAEWKDREIIVSAKLSEGPVKAVIPVKIEGTDISMDLSGIRVLGIPASKAAARINQFLANTTDFNSSVKGNQIIFDINELLIKSGLDIAKDFKIQDSAIGDNSVSFTISKKEQKTADFRSPEKQQPIVNKNIASPFAGIDTRGNGIMGVTYTKATPIGQSYLGSKLGLDKKFGTIENLSYSYLDHTCNFSASVSTDGAFRGDVSTGLRASSSPVGLPVYLQFDPIGLGLKINKNGVSPYVPLKIGVGYDDGKFTAGIFYQHNFVIGNQNDNIFGGTAGIRW